jgi:hypothetical protein
MFMDWEGRHNARETNLQRLKRKHGMENDSDEAFIGWWSRNHGTGYRDKDEQYLRQEEKEEGA